MTNRRGECLLKSVVDVGSVLLSEQQEDSVDLWTRSQQLLNDNFPDESRATGDENAPTRVELGNG